LSSPGLTISLIEVVRILWINSRVLTGQRDTGATGTCRDEVSEFAAEVFGHGSAILVAAAITAAVASTKLASTELTVTVLTVTELAITVWTSSVWTSWLCHTATGLAIAVRSSATMRLMGESSLNHFSGTLHFSSFRLCNPNHARGLLSIGIESGDKTEPRHQGRSNELLQQRLHVISSFHSSRQDGGQKSIASLSRKATSVTLPGFASVNQ